jgi:putative Mg2+ transporter-C (MgtC) family protein
MTDLLVNLCISFVLGALIGMERQWRQRMAGMRTNALVSVGAAMFVTLAGLTAGDSSPTRIAAQVASGIGFLGAGVIIRDGLNVRGLNTAATLWCSAGVGTLAGSGHAPIAAAGVALVLAANLGLRPLARRLDRDPSQGPGLWKAYLVRIECRSDSEQRIRTGLLTEALYQGLRLLSVQSRNLDKNGRVEIVARLTGPGAPDRAVEHVVGRLSLDDAVVAARWDSLDPGLGERDEEEEPN